MNTVKKNIVFLFSLILSILSLQNNFVYAEKPVKQVPEINKKVSYDKLKTNPNWLKLSQIWKNLNNIPADKRNLKGHDSMMSLQKNLGDYFNNLIKAKLITQDEKNLLLDLFNKRFDDLKFRMGIVTCYEPLPPGDNPASAGMDLEERYQILQKLADENKINSETYNTTKKYIEKDLKIINKASNQKLNNQFVDLIYYLSK